jgi:cellulose synthase/poly-beta-1,6-N-acetylglucosamine synthase-like glycosyltransferase
MISMAVLQRQEHTKPPPIRVIFSVDTIGAGQLSAPEPGARFAPLAPLRWAASTLAALAIIAVIGLVIPPLMRSIVQAALPPAPRVHPSYWVHLALMVGYWLFLATVVSPFLVFAAWSYLGRPAPRSARVERWPSVSILIPAFNEQEIILDAIGGALAQDYPDFEVIVIDDGSTDLTPYLVTSTGARLVRHERNKGKAAALNSGLVEARGEVIVTNDADGYLDPMALRHLVVPLADPSVGAVAGQVRLFHPKGSIRRFQVMEYDYCQALVKQAQYASAGTVLVAPGPVSAHRAKLLREIGGVPPETLTEDFDLTLQIIARGRRVAYEPRAIAYTEAPRTDAELRRQRIRWGRGALQVFAKHRRMLGSPGLGLFGMFWLPYSLLSWYAPAPFAILGLALLPLMAWGSHSPIRFLECLALYALPILLIELARVATGVVSSSRRDLRFLAYAPLFLVYQKIRLDWFPFESLYREWRHRPKTWND